MTAGCGDGGEPQKDPTAAEPWGAAGRALGPQHVAPSAPEPSQRRAACPPQPRKTRRNEARVMVGGGGIQVVPLCRLRYFGVTLAGTRTGTERRDGERGVAAGARTRNPRRTRPAGPAGADGCSRSPAAVKQSLNYILVNIDCGHLLRLCAQKTKTLRLRRATGVRGVRSGGAGGTGHIRGAGRGCP